MTAISDYDRLEYNLVHALATLPAEQEELRPRALQILEKLRSMKRQALAANPEVLRKGSRLAGHPERAHTAVNWRGLPIDGTMAKSLAVEARDRASEQKRLAKAGSGPRRYAAPNHLRGRAVRLSSGGVVDVPETGFCSPAVAAVHPGYGPAADSATHHELVALGFRELPRNPDNAVGDAAAKSALRTALRSPVIGDAGLLGFLNRRAGR